MSEGERLILIFDSIHDVLAAEKLIQARGLFCDLVPTPKELSSDCGMSLECLKEDLQRLCSLREEGLLQWRSLHSA